MRRLGPAFTVACLLAGAGSAAADRLGVAAGVSIGGIPAYGQALSGAGPAAELEVGLTGSWSAGLELRRHHLYEETAPEDGVRGRSREVALSLRHAALVISGRRYLDFHGGLGVQRLALDGRAPVWRRYLQLGINLLQPGSVYHLTDHLELRFGIDLIIGEPLREPGLPSGCTGPCTDATAGPPHDLGVFGTITLGAR
ncbi:MAG TPA: hypothetical protein VL172_05380 [Kofleriaceae bacterium]|nr:hypothetical protein [Kofleriaceae bacterium]